LNYKKILKGLGIVIWCSIPFFVLFFPVSRLEQAGDICLSKLVFDMECLGCGLTRATFYIVKLNFAMAWQLNKLSFITTPVFILFYFHILGRLLNKPILSWMRKYY